MLSSFVNKENTPRKQHNSQDRVRNRLYVEDTPSPKQHKHKKVLVNYNQYIPDTPIFNINQNQKIRKLLNPNQLNDDDLPGDDDDDVGRYDKISVRNNVREPRSSVRNIFKPKLKQVLDKSTDGCNDSFETLQKRANSRNRKVIRLSEVLSELDINEQKNDYPITSTANKQDDEHEMQTFNTCSFTHVTNCSDDLTITICNGNTSVIRTFQQYINNNTEQFTNVFNDDKNEVTYETETENEQEDKTTKDEFTQSVQNRIEETTISDNESHSVYDDDDDDDDRSNENPKKLNRTYDVKDTQENEEEEHNATCNHQYIPDTNPYNPGFLQKKCYLNTNHSPKTYNNQDVCEYNDISDEYDEQQDNDNHNEDKECNNNDRDLFIQYKNVQKRIELNNKNVHRVNDNSYSSCKKPHITYTSLTKMQLKLLKRIVKLNFNKNTVLEKKFNAKTTHLIVGGNDYAHIHLNAKILLAILNNCKLIRFDWVLKSSNEKNWLKENEYAIDEYKKYIETYKSMRNELDLFSKYKSIYICLNITESERDYYYELILKCMGHLTSRPNRATLILCNNPSCKYNADLKKVFKNKQKCIPIVSVNWILDCVLSLKTLDYNKYILSNAASAIQC